MLRIMVGTKDNTTPTMFRKMARTHLQTPVALIVALKKDRLLISGLAHSLDHSRSKRSYSTFDFRFGVLVPRSACSNGRLLPI